MDAGTVKKKVECLETVIKSAEKDPVSREFINQGKTIVETMKRGEHELAREQLTCLRFIIMNTSVPKGYQVSEELRALVLAAKDLSDSLGGLTNILAED